MVTWERRARNAMSVFLLASLLTIAVSLPAASLEVHEFNVSNPDPAAAIQIFGAQAEFKFLRPPMI